MVQKESEEKEKLIELQVAENDKLNIFYAKTELKEFFPNLTSEIIEEKKTMKILSIEKEEKGAELAKSKDYDVVIQYEENLSNPGVLDFLRRCSTIEEALEILEYLNARHELPEELFVYLKERVSQKGELIKLIDECGGPKKKGYYIDKFYKMFDKV